MTADKPSKTIMAPTGVRRRSKGEGSFWQQPNGTWRGYVPVEGQPGRRKYFSGKTERAVRTLMRSALRDMEAGLDLSADRITLATYLTNWLEAGAALNLSPVTYSSYEMQCRVHIIPALGHVALQKLTSQQIQIWINTRTQKGVRAITVRYAYMVLKTALHQAVKWHMLTRNPAADITLPRLPHVEIKYWTPEQARTFLKYVKGDRLEALYALGLSLGMRRGELLGLTWSACDLDKGTITVRTNLQRLKSGFALLEPKTKGSRRTLTCPAFVVALLKARRDGYHEERALAGDRWQGAQWNLVFGMRTGLPTGGQKLAYRFDCLSEAAGLPRITVHGIRHTAATSMIAAGVNLKVVSMVLGHSKITTTLDIYSHVMESQLDQAAASMQSLLADFGVQK